MTNTQKAAAKWQAESELMGAIATILATKNEFSSDDLAQFNLSPAARKIVCGMFRKLHSQGTIEPTNTYTRCSKTSQPRPVWRVKSKKTPPTMPAYGAKKKAA